jgi:hypothetical protein
VTSLEELLVEGNNFLLEYFRANLLGQRRGLHAHFIVTADESLKAFTKNTLLEKV